MSNDFAPSPALQPAPPQSVPAPPVPPQPVPPQPVPPAVQPPTSLYQPAGQYPPYGAAPAGQALPPAGLWGQQNTAPIVPPYAPSAFKSQKSQKANIGTITNYLVRQLSDMGMSVVVTRSRISKSNSRYLRVDAVRRQYTVRVSDHALRQGKVHDFYVYTHTPYEKALHYKAFLAKFREIIGEIEGLNLGKFRKNEEFEKVCQEPQ
jgi:hypothetical protein